MRGLKSTEKRFKSIDEMFELINERFRQVDMRFEDISKRLDRIETFIFRSTIAIKSINEFTIDMIGYEGVLRREAVTLVKREIEHILSFVLPTSHQI